MFERLGRWTWDRYQHRWGAVLGLVFALIFCVVLMVPSILNVALVFELSVRQGLTTYLAVALVGFLIHFVGLLVTSREQLQVIDRWVAGDHSDPHEVRQVSLHMVSEVVPRLLRIVGPPMIVIVSGAIAWSNGLGWQGAIGIGIQAIGVIVIDVLFAVISFEALFRPLREEIDAVVSSSPQWQHLELASRLRFGGAMTAWACGCIVPAFVVRFDTPGVQFGVAGVAAAVVAVWLGLGVFGDMIVAPVLRPLDDLLRGTRRVAAGVYDTRLPLTTDDEFGELVASFNQMQTGLLERERLHAAFGSYVDPALAVRLMTQGDDLFAGEEVEVTVFFADVRDFTPYAETATPREAVERLNALFSLVVPILREHHGHANKFLGDGVLAVFGVPEPITDHADRALAAACEIQRQVREAFGGELRLGIGVNTGRVIAGTIGGGGKLEFTLIGDAVNVASRVEERTKTTGDAILLTQSTLDALSSRPKELLDRGEHELKGKAAATRLYSVQVRPQRRRRRS